MHFTSTRGRAEVRRLCALTVLGLVLACGVLRADDLDQDEARRLREEGAIMPLDALLMQVLQRHPGARLLEAELEREDGVYIYEIDLLTRDGVARELELDARDGRVLEDEVDD